MQVVGFFHAVAESLNVDVFIKINLVHHFASIWMPLILISTLGEWSSVSNLPPSLANASPDILER